MSIREKTTGLHEVKNITSLEQKVILMKKKKESTARKEEVKTRMMGGDT